MKKTFSVLMVLVLLALPLFALIAEATDNSTVLEVLEEKALVFDSFWGLNLSYTALVKNNAEFDILVDNVILEGKDKDDNVVIAEQLFNINPYILGKGEQAVVNSSMVLLTQEQRDAITGWHLTASGYRMDEADSLRFHSLPSESAFEITDDEIMGKEAVVTSTLKNDSKETLYDILVVVLLRDQNGKLITATNTQAYEVGVPAGGTIYLRSTLSGSLLSALEAEGIAITTAESFAYIQMENAPAP